MLTLIKRRWITNRFWRPVPSGFLVKNQYIICGFKTSNYKQDIRLTARDLSVYETYDFSLYLSQVCKMEPVILLIPDMSLPWLKATNLQSCLILHPSISLCHDVSLDGPAVNLRSEVDHGCLSIDGKLVDGLDWILFLIDKP